MLSIQALNNAQEDLEHIEDVANSPELTATDRLGHTKDTIAGAVYKIAGINDRGAWATATAYATKDIVLQGGTWYVCVIAHTSAAAFATDSASKWRVYQGVTSGDLSASSGAGLIGWIRSATGAIARTVADWFEDQPSVMDFIPFATRVAIRMRTSTTDLSAYVAAAYAANAVNRWPKGRYYVSALDLTAIYGSGVVGDSLSVSHGTEIVIDATNAPGLRGWGPVRWENFYIRYAAQQTVAHTESRTVEFNNIGNGASIRNVRAAYGNTNFGIKQATFGATVYNTLFDAHLDNLQSQEASEAHFDLRNFNGGGTNVEIGTLYVNGGAPLDHSSSGQSAKYAIRGTNWSGYEVGAVSIDGLHFTERLVDLQNCYARFNTLRYEAVTCKKDNDGWFALTGADNDVEVSLLDIKNTRALLADVPTATYLFRASSIRYKFKLGSLRASADCSFTAPLMRPLTLTGGNSSSVVKLGPMYNLAAGFTTTTWTDGTGLTPYTVQELDGRITEKSWKFGRNTNTYNWRYDSVAPASGAQTVGNITLNSSPVAGGHIGWVNTTAGSPGTNPRWGFIPLDGSATVDPVSLADGAGETHVVAVSGAVVGDFVTGVSFSNSLGGITLTGWVSAAGQVSCRFQNETGGVIDLASGTLRVRVEKQ